MDTNTAIVCVAIVIAATLLVLRGIDFEGGGKTLSGEFFFRTKKRKP
jgi:hypothetical protein